MLNYRSFGRHIRGARALVPAREVVDENPSDYFTE
jgi:hypothetical protein